MQKLKQKIEKATPELKKELGVKNAMALPKLVKVVISSGTGKAKDKKRNEMVESRLAKITGQKPAPRGAKKSIASFKVRQGDVVGYAVTLRGPRMYDFLDLLLNIAIPRIRDFKGYDPKIVDEVGNLTLPIKEHVVFPQTADEELKDIFGLAVTIVTTAKDKKSALAFFKAIGFPFRHPLVKK
ncbi:MAG: 50S ribosomal protein L5 [Candidatus Paceibacterota bacterium]|jgi:large subunit ribosomal protein L5